MGGVNRTIIASVVIIMAAGMYRLFVAGGRAALAGPGPTRIIVGAYMLALFASLFDLIGFGVGKVAGWILALAVGVAVFTVINDLAIRTKQAGLPVANATAGAGGTPTKR